VGTGAGDVLVFDALGALADVLPPPPPAQPTLPPRSMSSSAPAPAGAPPGAERPATSASGATCAADAFEEEQAEGEGGEPAGEGAAAACSPVLWADGGGQVAPGGRPSRAGGASITGGGAARLGAAGCSTASFGRLLPPAIGAPTHPSSIESIVVNRGGSSAAPPAGAAAGPSRTWRFATAGSGGVVYFYAAAVAPARPASSQTPRRLLPRWDYPPLRPTAAAVLSTTAAPPAAVAGAAATAFRLAATAALPAAWEADATDVTIRRLCAAPSGGAVYAAVGGCHVFSVYTAKLAAPAAAAASPHAHRGGDHVQRGGEGASPRGGGDTATRDYTGADDDHHHSRPLQPPPPPLSSSLQPAHVTAPVVELPAMEPVEQLAAHDPPASAFASGRGDGAAAALTSCFAPSAALAGSGAAAGGGAPGGSAILSMDVAVRRPLVATVGPGGWLHVWNFAARTRELARVLPDAPGHVTMHPSGLSVAVSAPDRVSVLTLLLGDVKEAACVPLRGAAVLRYSRGGTLLAVAAGPVVHVLDGATLAFVVALRGHTGRVTQVTWAHNDATLLTVGADGALYEWDVREGKRAREFLHKGARVWGAAASMDGGTVYAVCTIITEQQHGGDSDAAGGGGAGGASDAPVSRHALLEVDMHRGALVSETPLPWPAACVAASQGTEQPMLFVGCAATACVGGAVRSLALPLSEGAGAGATVGGPAAGCVAMQLSVDGARLFVAGCDGSLVVYDVRDRDGRVPLSDASAMAPWCDEVLVAVADYEERKAEARELREQLAELASNSDYAVRVKEIAFRDQIKALTERCVRASARACGGGVCCVACDVGGMRLGAKRCCRGGFRLNRMPPPPPPPSLLFLTAAATRASWRRIARAARCWRRAKRPRSKRPPTRSARASSSTAPTCCGARPSGRTASWTRWTASTRSARTWTRRRARAPLGATSAWRRTPPPPRRWPPSLKAGWPWSGSGARRRSATWRARRPSGRRRSGRWRRTWTARSRCVVDRTHLREVAAVEGAEGENLRAPRPQLSGRASSRAPPPPCVGCRRCAPRMPRSWTTSARRRSSTRARTAS
jgi:hypothetical protein